ncbi:hypothetical protein, partial [Paraburkholderia sediminicola]|uniref:hypothetical protein n=1 Tax=Paraburkholderia sediminicola TaxID=458836 RepID=UPI0038BB3B5B
MPAVVLNSIRDLAPAHRTELETHAFENTVAEIWLDNRHYGVTLYKGDLVVKRSGLDKLGRGERFFAAIADVFHRFVENPFGFGTRSQQMTNRLKTLKNEEPVNHAQLVSEKVDEFMVSGDVGILEAMNKKDLSVSTSLILADARENLGNFGKYLNFIDETYGNELVKDMFCDACKSLCDRSVLVTFLNRFGRKLEGSGYYDGKHCVQHWWSHYCAQHWWRHIKTEPDEASTDVLKETRAILVKTFPDIEFPLERKRSAE